MSNKDIAMQTYCVHCGKEQYAPAVWAISNGTHPCTWCGENSKPMDNDKYYETMKKRRENENN